MTEGNRNIMDPTGWVAEKLEWFVTYYLFADDDVSLSLCNSLPCPLLDICTDVKRSFVVQVIHDLRGDDAVQVMSVWS